MPSKNHIYQEIPNYNLPERQLIEFLQYTFGYDIDLKDFSPVSSGEVWRFSAPRAMTDDESKTVAYFRIRVDQVPHPSNLDPYANLLPYLDLLDSLELFTEENQLDSWKGLLCYNVHQHGSSNLQPTTFSTMEHLERHLTSSDNTKKDPICRIIFLRALTSRSPLQITRDAFAKIVSHHQVTPYFLDLLTSFGAQPHVRKPLIGGYQSNSRYDDVDGSSEDTQKHSSKRQLDITYTLYAPERTRQDQHVWSIKQCSLCHKFDLVDERQFWVIVKANDLIQKLVCPELLRYQEYEASSKENFRQGFLFSLESHMRICQWSVEDLDWYLTCLEDEMHKTSKSFMAYGVSKDLANNHPRAQLPHLNELVATVNGLDPVGTNQLSRRKRRHLTDHFLRPAWMSFFKNVDALDQSTQIEMGPQSAKSKSDVFLNDAEAQTPYDFPKVREFEYYADTGRDAMFMLKANLEAIEQLSQEYQILCESNMEPDFKIYRDHIHRFAVRLNSLGARIRVLQARVEFHMTRIADRKEYVHALLQQRNLQSMETVTQDMHDIAKRTEKETVRMRIITVVTLFFLPGTFVATLMSTAVVRFPEPPATDTSLYDVTIGNGALQLYVLLSVPLVCLTFFSWFLLNRYGPSS